MKRVTSTGPKQLTVEQIELSSAEARWVAGGAKGSGSEGCCDNTCRTWCGPKLPDEGVPF